ncbi:hypothetical protein RclHR1_02550007 [Rhizophagus clarus]|uniref:Uncharacterized protein n=1 Tax=Rhizophagus clarus TaxID=94130 RepID=A0A2Z6R0P2_9GLOM|nr:hypothetical protein RclHR1_02550007 [Rhizophagus clarus]
MSLPLSPPLHVSPSKAFHRSKISSNFVLRNAISRTYNSQSVTNTSQFDWQDMPLKDRNLSKIAVIVKNNVFNNLKAGSSRSYVKSDFNILVCGGVPGIGKTRCGDELFRNIETDEDSLFTSFKHFEYIYLDFGNSIRLDKQDYSLKNEEIICLRILYEYFIMKNYYLDFIIFRERFLPYIKILNIQNVFESIRNRLSLEDTE